MTECTDGGGGGGGTRVGGRRQSGISFSEDFGKSAISPQRAPYVANVFSAAAVAFLVEVHLLFQWFMFVTNHSSVFVLLYQRLIMRYSF